MTRVNVLVLIHGITPEGRPSPRDQYRPFLDGLAAAWRGSAAMDDIVEVTWGVDPPAGSSPRPDQHLAAAQRHVSELVRNASVRADDAPQNELLHGLRSDFGIPGMRQLFTTLREQLVQFGLADAVYYASADGEAAVRDAIYGQVLAALDRHRSADEVRLHIAAHSLGVTVAHDLLFGFFRTAGTSDYVTAGGPAAAGFAHWSARARNGTLKLGSFLSMASQLPIFVLRKQALVERLAAGHRLDPKEIGIDPNHAGTHWAIFYDLDDVLGFATRRLYEPTASIRDIQTKTGLEPLSAHLGYWKSSTVIEQSAAILAANA